MKIGRLAGLEKRAERLGQELADGALLIYDTHHCHYVPNHIEGLLIIAHRETIGKGPEDGPFVEDQYCPYGRRCKGCEYVTQEVGNEKGTHCQSGKAD